MKVEGPRRGAEKTGNKKSVSSKDNGAFSALVKQAADLHKAQDSRVIGALTALPVPEDSLSGKSPEQQAKEQADTLLLQLETLRLGLLNGSLPVKVLHNLAAGLKKQRPHIQDPRLMEILDEIDLRAQVELAKYDRK